jgi:hypothetical protein
MTDWLDLPRPRASEAPYDARPAHFLLRSGEEVVGVLEPFWCDSDCPCNLGDDLGCFPDCWWLPDREEAPTHWSPL